MMIRLPEIPKTFLDLLTLSIRYHFPVFRKMVWLILFFVIVKDAYVYLGGMPTSVYGYTAVGIVMTILILYLLTAMLYTAHCVLYNENIDWRSALSDSVTRMGRVILGFVVLAAIPVVLSVAGYFIAQWIMAGDAKPNQYANLVLVLAVGVPVMLIYLYYFFVIPLIAAENFSVWQALKHSPLLIGQQWLNLVRTFGVYICLFAVWILISPDTLHGHLMKMYKLSALFDFIVLSVTLPIVMNFILLMRNDLRLREGIDCVGVD